jgi:excisionase family DNA binding protein
MLSFDFNEVLCYYFSMELSVYYTTTEAAKVLGVSRIAVFQKIKEGKIKAKKAGRNYLILKKEILEAAGQVLSPKRREEIESGVDKVITEYGEVLRRLGKE